MAITGVSNYGNAYESLYTSQRKERSEREQTGGTNRTSGGKPETAKKVSNEEYLKDLQKQVPYVKLQAGSGNNAKMNGKAVLDISPKLLEKMQNDPEAAKKYTQTLKDIERAEKIGDAYYNALGGVVERWSYWHIDENGKYYHFAYTRRDDKLNKKLREEAKKNAEDLIEKTRENSRKKKEQLAEKLDKVAEEADIEESYLSDKYRDFSFVAADYAPGMRYGSNATTNIAISPEFLKKMANDPELEKEYESYFGGMQRLDKENIRTHEARGRHIIAQGWAIDKDGGISRWGISEPTDKRHYGQETMDYVNKIREQALEEKQAEEKLEEKHNTGMEVPGTNLDMKI